MRASWWRFGLVTVVVAVACGGSTEDESGSGQSPTGGTSGSGGSDGTGAEAPGGAGSGGARSGGTENGAAAGGGAVPGGASNGGDETGGSSSGGAGTGGAPTGGATAGGAETGGNATGGVSPGGAGGVPSGGDGSGGGPTGGNGTGGIDCSTVGCALPPLCAEGCTEPCGCCFCGDGQQTQINDQTFVCRGGCWDEPDCIYAGYGYFAGDSFAATDGCNTCSCSDGGSVGCTELACPCDPDQEYWRDYVGTPATCPVIDFVCPAGASYFGNDCGCGCEQSTDCPEWLDCMPGSAPPECGDLEAYAAICPYTEIVY